MKQNLVTCLNNIEWFNTLITGILQAEQENGVDKIFKEMMVENVLPSIFLIQATQSPQRTTST